MNEEEKKVAEAKALADKVLAEAEAAKLLESQIDPLAEKDAEIAKLIEERDNYKAVALKRKGKLAEDDDFFAKEGIDEFIEDKVKNILADKEIGKIQAEKDAQLKQIIKENSELKLALKNRPGSSIGEGSGSSLEVKDNVFTPDQLRALEIKAKRLGADPQKFIEQAKQNLLNRR